MNLIYHLRKNALLLLLVACSINIQAQVNQNSELKVVMNDIISFTLNDLNPTLIFDDADDFINGVTYTASNAGTITATSRFDVSVQSSENFLSDGAGNEIKTNKIRIQASGENLGNNRKRRINTNKKNIIGNAPPCIAKSFNLTYFTKPNDNAFIGKPAGDYTVELIFIATLD